MTVARPRLLAAVVLGGVFALGTVGGAVGAALLAHRHIRTMMEGTEEDVEVRVEVAFLGRALRMPDDERARLREVLQRGAIVHSKLREAIEPGLEALRQRERGEVRALLTPEQQVHFDRLSALVDARRGRVERLLEK